MSKFDELRKILAPTSVPKYITPPTHTDLMYDSVSKDALPASSLNLLKRRYEKPKPRNNEGN